MPLRTFIAASVVGLSLACMAGFASAQQIYKWKDGNGVIHFSQTPPAAGTHYTRMNLTNTPDVSANPPATSPGTNGTQPSNPSPPQAASGGTQPDTPANREQLCNQLTSNIALLQGKKPVVSEGGSGKQQVMSDKDREQQLSTARAQQAEYCSSKGA
ncbi:MAG: DUF4124 domain-containing protein [Xanthomonadaceae bacterium]|nr:DUF4124 domain-containing protein [Xanthomonadaceae bacterium]